MPCPCLLRPAPPEAYSDSHSGRKARGAGDSDGDCDRRQQARRDEISLLPTDWQRRRRQRRNVRWRRVRHWRRLRNARRQDHRSWGRSTSRQRVCGPNSSRRRRHSWWRAKHLRRRRRRRRRRGRRLRRRRRRQLRRRRRGHRRGRRRRPLLRRLRWRRLGVERPEDAHSRDAKIGGCVARLDQRDPRPGLVPDGEQRNVYGRPLPWQSESTEGAVRRSSYEARGP